MIRTLVLHSGTPYLLKYECTTINSNLSCNRLEHHQCTLVSIQEHRRVAKEFHKGYSDKPQASPWCSRSRELERPCGSPAKPAGLMVLMPAGQALPCCRLPG